MRRPRDAGGALLALTLCMGAMALACGLILATGQSARLLGMRPDVLAGSPFDNFVIPGVILALAVGGSHLAAAAAWVAARDARWAAAVSLVAGGVLVGWIVGEVALLGWIAPRGLQPFCGAYGALEVALAGRWLRRGRPRQPARRAAPRAAVAGRGGRGR